MTTARLGDVAEFVNGAAFKPGDWHGDGLPIIRIQNLTDPTKAFNRTRRAVPDKLHVLPGDLLVSWSATLGVFEWPLASEEAVLNQHIFRVLPRSEVVEKRYLMYALDQALSAMGKHLHGATMKHINRAEFLATVVPLPSMKEQRRIAAVLSESDELRAKTQASIALIDELNDSVFLHLFGDPIRNSKAWPVASLTDIAHEVQIGPFGSLLHQHDYAAGGIPVVKPMHIVNSEIVTHVEHAVAPSKAASLGRYLLKAGDIVMARRGEMGRCALIDRRSAGMICGSGSLFIRPNLNHVTARYLHQVLTSPGMKRHLERSALGVTMANLNAGIVGALPIPVPPLGEQRRFEEVRTTAMEQRARVECSRALAHQLFSSLQHRAFAGQL